jgi:hypothetical protein
MANPEQKALATGTVSDSDRGPANLHVTLAHLPSAIPASEFGDPEWGPLCMRDTLRNATFLGFFENLENQIFDASS